MEERYKKALINLNRLIFQYLLMLYLLLLLIREFSPKFLYILNLNYVLIAVILLGVITVLTYKPKEKKLQKPTKFDYYLIYFLGVIGAVLIFIKIKELGWLSYLIAAIAGILIILLSKLVLEEENEKEKD